MDKIKFNNKLYYELQVLRILINEIWLKKYEIEAENDGSLEKNAQNFRKEISEKFNLFLRDGSPKGFINNIKSALGKGRISHYPQDKTIESLCAYYYDYTPETKDAWEKEFPLKKYWKRFSEDPILKNKVNKLLQELEVSNRVDLPDEGSSGNASLIPVIESELEKAYRIVRKLDIKEGEPINPKIFNITFTSVEKSTIWATVIFFGIFLIGSCFSLAPTFLPIEIFEHIKWLAPDIDETTQAQMISKLKDTYNSDNQYTYTMLIISLLQALIIGGFIFYYFTNISQKEENQGRIKIIDASILQFEAGWISIWISLGFLYIWLAFQWYIFNGYAQFFRDGNGKEHFVSYNWFNLYSWVFADFFNFVVAFFYFFLYYILDSKSIATENNKDRNRLFIVRMKRLLLVILFLWIGTAVERYYTASEPEQNAQNVQIIQNAVDSISNNVFNTKKILQQSPKKTFENEVQYIIKKSSEVRNNALNISSHSSGVTREVLNLENKSFEAKNKAIAIQNASKDRKSIASKANSINENANVIIQKASETSESLLKVKNKSLLSKNIANNIINDVSDIKDSIKSIGIWASEIESNSNNSEKVLEEINKIDISVEKLKKGYSKTNNNEKSNPFFEKNIFLFSLTLLLVLSICLFVSRLSSHYLSNSNRKAIPFFYAFACFQFGYYLLDKGESIQIKLFIMIFVIILKIYLFIEVTKLIAGKNLQDYYARLIVILSEEDGSLSKDS